MKRRHLRADALAFAKRARALRPDMAFGADLIAGFPTETEAQFRETLDLVEAMELTFLHVFPYRERRGPPGHACRSCRCRCARNAPPGCARPARPPPRAS